MFLCHSFFLHTGRLWNSLSAECFQLTYDLNGLKSRVNRHLLSLGSFWIDFLLVLLFLLLFLETQCLVGTGSANPIHFYIIVTKLLQESNESSWVFPAFEWSPNNTVLKVRFNSRSQLKPLPHLRILIPFRSDRSIDRLESNTTDNIIWKDH